MRLPIISPDKLTDEQKTLADDMKEGIAKSFQGFVNYAMMARYSVPGIHGCTSRSSASRSGN